ncbi:hypothetical protein Q7P37_004232 [Cladosporium fusiforme]
MSVAPPRGGPKRGPTVLVTDSRDELRPQNRPSPQRQNTRIISVDNVLQYASEIPSAQRRAPPGTRPTNHTRTPSGRHPLNPKLGGRMPEAATLTPRGTPVSAPHIPTRSSKVSEKLVLLPETTEEDGDSDADDDEDGDERPPDDEEVLRRKARKSGKSRAERLPKSQRTAEAQLARVTAYCTAQSYKLRSMATFVKDQHGAKTKLYDDCLYCVYQLPLLGGSEGYRVRSSPVVKNPGGRSVLDEQIEANERREYREGWRDESDEYSVVGNESYNTMMEEQQAAHQKEQDDEEREQRESHFGETNHQTQEHNQSNGELRRESTHSTGSSGMSIPSPGHAISPDAHTVAELFVFSYGVAVFWNFTSNQEKDLLADLTFSSAVPMASSSSHHKGLSQKDSLQLPAVNAVPLLTRPLDEGDFETEEFHFEYDEGIEKARIYNDMITLRTSDHMIKLAMSHGIGQSTKLSFFEERMQRTMAEAQYVPKQLALEGRLGMSRAEVVSLVGSLFEGRVDVNLSSNMLDTPKFFWDSEPTLHPLYQGVREYLEIKPRIQVLNERCRVFLDLAEILSDQIADVKMTRITWIIIVLIILSILVTSSEVILRFGILAASGKGDKDGAMGGTIGAFRPLSA